jgi:serine/threonine protein kinase
MESREVDDFNGNERFDVRRRVGAGGMGAVYEAYDRERDMRVAIKTILNVDASLRNSERSRMSIIPISSSSTS